ncbi:MAG TPA: TonB-dependent receptor [Gemmatimonadaceae bacterium]|nr:TonB-dependent receptor [Gemmatimonadaceae bacterium]
MTGAAARSLAVSLLALGSALVPPRALVAQSASCGSADDVVPAVPPQGWAPPLDRTVSLDARDVSLRDALDRLAAAADVRLSYSPDVVPVDRRVCASFHDVALGGALSELLRGAGVEARAIGGSQVVLAPLRDPTAGAPREPTMLERVIVTGSAAGAPERPLSVEVTTISGAALRARGAGGTVAEALSGAVPGVWAWAQPPASLLVRYASIRGASSFDAYPKVYIDGIEVASPLLVSRIDPATVDRIEIIRGPQGAALYGSDAISGVVNIVTRTDGVADGSPRFGIDASGGAVTSDYVARPTVTQRYGVTVRAGSSTRAATLGIAAGGTGPYVPGAWGRDVSGVLSTRLVGARSIVNAMARLSLADASATESPVLADSVFHATGMSGSGPIAFTPASVQSSREYTAGTTIRLMQSSRLTHSVVLGVDGYRLSGVPAASTAIPSAADAALRDAAGGADRGSLRLATIADLGHAAGIGTTLTLGAERSILRSATVSTLAPTPLPMPVVRGESPRGPLLSDGGSGPGSGHDGGRLDDVAWRTNTGLIAQLNAALLDVAYLTAGARLERSGGFPGAGQWNVLPLVGVALVRGTQDVQLKVRGAYGRGIRGPRTASRETMSGSGRGRDSYGGEDEITRRGIAAESQRGSEAGFDLYVGRIFALRATRFNQVASGLIQRVAIAIDTTYRSGSLGPRQVEYALQNVGRVSNRGWEIDGTFTRSALSLSGSFSAVSSIVRQLDGGYTGDLRTNDRMLEVPARTASLTAAWTGNGWLASVTAARASDWINYDRIGLAWSVVHDTRPPDQPIGDWLRGYWHSYSGVTRVRAALSRDVTPSLTAIATGENLLDYQRGEPDNVTIVPGRTVSLGIRAAF